tara:strand:- start:2446 stop:2754 length:309 start_codon:yes stop_codon:yes gene_type:complete
LAIGLKMGSLTDPIFLWEKYIRISEKPTFQSLVIRPNFTSNKKQNIMNHSFENTSIMDKVLYSLSGDTMLLSDKIRIASFLETTRRTSKTTKKSNKGNDLVR